VGAGESERRQAGHNAAHRKTSLPIYILVYSTSVVDLNPNPVEPGTFSQGQIQNKFT
jgi:hypothetical protein